MSQSAILAEFLRRTPKSQQLAARAAGVFPSGVTHDGRYLKPHPVYVERAAGSRKWDVDGNEYVDYAGGHGALLLGHNHPQVLEAISQQLPAGTHYGACHELEIRWGELVQQLIPSAERVRFTSSGTEATLLAMRLSRAATGKPKVLRFLGHFHGWQDHVAFGVSSHLDGTPTPGVLPEIADNTLLCPPGDIEAVRNVLESRDDVAAVILEPTGASWGKVPLAPEFLTGLRQLTTEQNVILIFDEVISGFRCSPGGAQAVYGIRPDLTTLAKILAGGLPGGAVCGRADLLEQLDFKCCESAGREKISHHGTFNANPLSAAAGVAALKIVAETDACQQANDYAARLRDALNDVIRAEQIPWVVYGTFSGFHFFFNPEELSLSPEDLQAGKVDFRTLRTSNSPELVWRLRLGMICQGVEIFNWPGGPTSAVHTDADLQQTAEALRKTIRLLKQDGDLDPAQRGSATVPA